MPKHRVKRAEKLRRNESKKVMLSLSLVTVVMFLVFVADLIQKQSQPTILITDNAGSDHIIRGLAPGGTLKERLNYRKNDLNNRMVASDNQQNFRDLEWEKKMIEKLSGQSRSIASLKVSPEDQFKYGYLGGNYRIVNEETNGEMNLVSLEFSEGSSDLVAQPILFDVPTFVRSYRSLGLHFSEYKIENVPEGKKLILFSENNNREVIGEVYIKLKDNRLISAKVQRM
jgi:hypothetical protein